MPKLKDLALERIKGEVKSCDAVEETFSKFTSRLVYSTSLPTIDISATYTRYPVMIDLHAGNLASALLSPNSQDIEARLNEKLESFADGEIPHAADAVSALFGILARYRASDMPSGANNANPRAESRCTWAAGGNYNIPPHRKSMNIALIKSMHHGSFLDMEYCVRKKRFGANRFTPIYLSSSIFRDVRSKLDARRSHHIPTRSVLTRVLQWFEPIPTLGRERLKWIVTAIMKRSPPPAPRTPKLMAPHRRETFRVTSSCLVLSRREFE